MIGEIMTHAGHDPEKKIADRVGGILDGVRDALMDGHPEAVGVYGIAKQLARDSSDTAVRDEAAKTISVLEKGGSARSPA